MKKINIFGINRLRNHDFPRVYTLIVSQFEEEVFAVEDVQLAYEVIKAHDMKLNFIKSGIAKHPLTEVIANLRDIRHQCILSLRGRTKYSMKSPFAGEREAANIIFEWLEKEHKFLRSRSIQQQAQSVTRMKHDLGLMPELLEHLATLGLSKLIQSIISTTDEIDKNYKVRIAEKAANTRKSSLMRREAYDAMDTFVVAINQAIKLKKGDVTVHQNYLNQIAGLVSGFQSQQISKATRKKNAAELAEAEANQRCESLNGEQTSEGDVQPIERKPKRGKSATARRRIPFGAMATNGINLQNGGAPQNSATHSDGTRSAFAMSENKTNNEVSNGSATNSGATNSAFAVKTNRGMEDLSVARALL